MNQRSLESFQEKEKLRLKEPCHEVFDFRFFSSINSIWALGPQFKAFLHMASYSGRYSTLKSNILWPAVSMTPLGTGQRCKWHRVASYAYFVKMISGVIDTADQGTSKFTLLWLLLKGIPIEKSYIGKLCDTISTTFIQKIWGLTKDHFCGQRCHWHCWVLTTTPS
jgi:hypothetical protein